MQFMALIYEDPARTPAPGDATFQAMLTEYRAFTDFLKDKQGFVAGDALKPVQTATSVRVKGGKTDVMDGPFAETKEHLAGYYLMEAPDLDTAISWGARIPAAKHGTIEIRPVMQM